MAKILVVEDNPANMALATFLLQSVGHTVVGARDAETGVRAAREERPNLILMDIQLPGMDGLEAIALLKRDEATSPIPVIALTALAMKGDEERIRAAGCEGYIAKPICYQAFLATIADRLTTNAPASSDWPVRAARVLIVDDERPDRELFEVILGEEGLDVRTATSGEEALAIVAREPPDLVILDVKMTGMSGCQVANALKGDPATKAIPIVMVTAFGDRDARMLGLAAGAEDFLSKPVDRAELCVRVRNLLRLKAYSDLQAHLGRSLERQVGSIRADAVEIERLYRDTFEAAPVGIAHVGPDGRWLRANQRISDLLGCSLDELMTMSVQDMLEPEDATRVLATFGPMASGMLERPVVDEVRFRRRDGRIVWARVNASIHRDALGQTRHFIAVIEDITERRVLEAQLRQASKMDAIGQLAASVAHDFNNLLSVILSYSDMLAGDLQEGDPMRADLGEINSAGRRAVELTRQLLAFSRQQVLQPKVVDLSQVVDGMKKMLGRLLGADVELTTIAASELGMVMVDPGQMEQVIMNLAVNARDAMRQGGHLTIETSEVVLDEVYAAEHVGAKPGPHVMLAVSDNGVGMDKATQARMFEPFFTTKEAGKGTGLGLATVFGIVKQSGGTVWVYSERGQGTTFKLYFPKVEGTMAASAPAPSPDVATLRGSETILLVEDEALVRPVACAILRRYGYNVLEAQSGGDALLLCEQHPAAIHLLLTDVVMPRMSGRQLAERLRTLRPEMAVLYMSGYTDDSIVRHGILDSTVAFVQKPITPEALARKVRVTLDAAT